MHQKAMTLLSCELERVRGFWVWVNMAADNRVQLHLITARVQS